MRNDTPTAGEERARGVAEGGRAGTVSTIVLWLIQRCARFGFRTAMRHIVAGRLIDRDRPERGRFAPGEVTRLLEDTYRIAAELLPQARLDRYPKLGNRQNVYLAVLTLAAYRAFRAADIDRDYTIELIADAGWKVYRAGVWGPRLVARMLTRDPQRQMNLILRAWLAYPFHAPDAPAAPGYHVEAWAGEDRFYTYWTACPPYACVEALGTREEREAFFRIWCLYDYAIAREMVPGGRYVRPHCLARGDGVCDMEWLGTGGQRPGEPFPVP